MLCYFKYVNFFLDSLYQALGVPPKDQYLLEVIVPFGISFYTFEAISYTVDVYQGRLKAERNLPNFLLFILFFPHLVAGPIVRGRDFLPQAHRPKRWSWIRAQHGIQLIALGLFKKLAIADCMAIYSDRVWMPGQDVETLSSGAAWMAVIAFTIRVYCDFSGVFGHCPRLRASARLQAHRQLPDAVPVGQHRRVLAAVAHQSFELAPRLHLHPARRQSRRILVHRAKPDHHVCARRALARGDMVLAGVGSFARLHAHRAPGVPPVCRNSAEPEVALETRPGTVLRILFTLFFITLSMTFAQPSLEKALLVMQKLFVPEGGLSLPMDQNRLWWTLYLVVFSHLIVVFGAWKWVWQRLPGPVLGTGLALLFVASQVLSPDTTKAFVYFQF